MNRQAYVGAYITVQLLLAVNHFRGDGRHGNSKSSMNTHTHDIHTTYT